MASVQPFLFIQYIPIITPTSTILLFCHPIPTRCIPCAMEEFIKQATEYLKLRGEISDKMLTEDFKNSLLLFKPRIRIWSNLIWQAGFLWKEDADYDPAAVSEHLKSAGQNLKALIKHFRELPDFSNEKQVEDVLRKTAMELNLEAKALIHPVRVAITGRSVSPSLFAVLRVFGKQKSITRIESAIRRFCELGV